MSAPIALLCLLPALGGLPPDKPLDAALERFRAALSSREGGERSDALEALVALRDAGAAPDLLGELARSARDLSGKEGELDRSRQAIERHEALIETLRRLGQRDPGLSERIAEELSDLESERRTLARLQERVAALAAWREELLRATAGLLAAVGEPKRKKAEASLWADAEKHPEPDVRAAAGVVLGEIGPSGTALALARLCAESSNQVGRLRQRLDQELAEVRKEERRLQSASDHAGGRLSDAAKQQYDRVKAPAEALQREISGLEHVSGELARAAGRALVHETPQDLEQTIPALLRLLKKEQGLARLDLVGVLGSADNAVARAQLRVLVQVEEEPATRAELIDALAAQGDLEAVPWLIEQGLADPLWRVAGRAAAALARLRVKASIPLLIERLGAAQGRLGDEFEAALVSLTAQDFHGNVELWRRWWGKEGEAFEVAAQPARRGAGDPAGVAYGTEFFGIATRSQGVLFVLDLSGSMNFAMNPRRNPDDRPEVQPDLPLSGDISRLTAARQALTKTLGGLRDGARFNLVIFASDVWSWTDEPVEMSPPARAEVLDYLSSLKAGGGTNIYGALARAFELCGAAGAAAWREPVYDTIYLLTDGEASIGLSQDSEEILAMARDRNRSAGIVIHTVGLSAAHDALLLRRLAEQNGGIYAVP